MNAAVTIALVSILFIIYHFISVSGRLKTTESENQQVRSIVFLRLLGFVLFGFLPVIYLIFIEKINLSLIGIVIKPQLSTLWFTLGLGVLPILVNFFAARKEDNLAMYPQIRKKEWSIALIVLSALSWCTYLLGYEMMFRGYFFFYCLNELGLTNAIIINTSIYALVHVPKGHKEAIGAIPLGIILCLITNYTGTIWAAFWIHCILALSNEWFSLKYHPEMKIVK